MKRFFLVASFFFIFAQFSFAWTNNVGGGFTVPFSITGVEESGSDDIQQLGYGFEGTYIGVHETGFTVKANISFGLDTSKDINLQNQKTNFGAFENVVIGAGYSFVHTEKTLFGFTAMFGVEFGQYSVKDENGPFTYNEKSYEKKTTSLSLVTTSFGGDIFGIFRFTPRFGFFANVSARGIVTGNAENSEQYESKSNKKATSTEVNTSSSSLFGKFLVQPALGVIWTF